MSLVKQFNNKYLILIGIKLCQWIPKRLALALIEPASKLIAGFGRSDLIKAIKSNQKMVHQDCVLTDNDLEQKAQAVIKHALICYYDFFHNLNDPQGMSDLFPVAADLNRKFKQATLEKGALVIAPHISNFNLLYQVITQKGFRAKLLTLANLYSGYDVINKIRSQDGVEIVPVDEGQYFTETVEYLKSGGIAVTAVDRPVEVRKSKHKLRFFGHPSSLPAGYLSLPLAAEVPVIIVTARMKADGSYEFLFSDRIHLEDHGNKLDNILKNGEMILKRIEMIIKQAPEQWLMYYPVWPDQVE